MKLLIVTDAWRPQVNGVVRTLEQLHSGLSQNGVACEVLGPSGAMLPCPSYPEIKLTLEPTRAVQNAVLNFRPQATARRFCLTRGVPFTTSFHTRFPEYLKLRFGLPRRWTYKYLLSFHRPAHRVLAPSLSIKSELESRGFNNVKIWSRGVDTVQFNPERRQKLPFEPPIQLYVGRLAVEKNLEAFLSIVNAGTKVIVGEGPARLQLQRNFPNAVFLGAKFGEPLADIYASADVFVFPSLTDTFGLVLLEALASGVPVAAFKVPGPVDVVTDGEVGILAEDSNLDRAIKLALRLERKNCRRFAESHSWQSSIQQFSESLAFFGDVWADPQPGLIEMGL